MDQTVSPVIEKEENLYSVTYDGTQDYNDGPLSQDGEQEEDRIRRK